MPNPIRRLVARLRGGLRYLAFRRAQARAVRKAKRDDPNIYPLW